jgi:hypothetical protein
MADKFPIKTPTALRIAIAGSGLTQRYIAEQVGISEAQLSRIVNGLHVGDDMRRAIARCSRSGPGRPVAAGAGSVSATAAIRDASDMALEATALNLAEHRLLANLETPEVDSIAEEIVALRTYGVPDDVLARLLAQVAAALELNAQEGGCERQITGLLEALNTGQGRKLLAAEVSAGGVKALAVRLRPALRILGRPEAYAHDVAALVAASAIVAEALATVAPATVAAGGLRHELGARAHDLLLRLRDGAS